MTEEVMKKLDGLLADLAIAHFGCGQAMGDDKRFEEYFDKAATAKKALCGFVAAQLHQGEADRERLDAFEAFALENHGDGDFSTDVVTIEGQPPCGCDEADCDADDDDSRTPIEWSVAGPRTGPGEYAIGQGPTLRAAIDAARSAALSPAKETGNG